MGRLYDTFLRKKPQQSRSRAVVDAILTAALEAVARGTDEEKLSINETAERAGVGIGSLYDYFRDRDGLVAALAAKLTEDNLASFESVLNATRGSSLRVSIEALVDHAIRTYGEQPKLARIALRAAHRTGLMPMLAHNQAVFAKKIGEVLRERSDVRRDVDLDALSFVLLNSLMGVVHTTLWLDENPFSLQSLREELVDMVHRSLAASSDAR